MNVLRAHANAQLASACARHITAPTLAAAANVQHKEPALGYSDSIDDGALRSRPRYRKDSGGQTETERANEIKRE